MERREKSILAFQVEGRLSAYLSDIDDCDTFTSNSKTILTKTMKMTECIHSLLGHIKSNCIKENKEFIRKRKLNVDNNNVDKILFHFNWTPTQKAVTISGIVKISFQVPNIEFLQYSNFKTDTIDNLTNLLIDLTTLTYVKQNDIVEKNVFIIKTRDFQQMTQEYTTLLKTELKEYCSSYDRTPTFIYLKHKDSIGHFHKHYSNYEEK